MHKSILLAFALLFSTSVIAQKADYYFEQGNKSLNEQNNRDAIEYYLQAIDLDNTNWTYYYNCGMAYYYLSDYKKISQLF